jgi:hypothetical protein
MLLWQADEGYAEEPFEQGCALAVTLGYQAAPGRWQGHLNAARDGHRRSSERSVISMCNLSSP